MKWASSLAAGGNLADLVARAASDLRARLGEEPVDLLLAFVSHQHHEGFRRLPDLLQEHLPAHALAGCSAASVLADGQEEEGRPALALMAARLPGVTVGLHTLTTRALPDEDAPPDVWRSWVGVPHADAHFVLLADPFTTQAEPLLTGLDYAYPSASKVGGLASGGRLPGQNALFVQDQVRDEGALLISFRGNVRLDTVVAQGCRPIGQTLTITKRDGNVLLEVNHQPPLKYLAELLEHMSDYDRQLMRTSLFLGLHTEDPGPETPRSEYLIRNLVGIDYQRGVLAVSAPLEVGQVVRFHLRDQVTSAEDLEIQLTSQRERMLPATPHGVLLFSCLGRGRRLYGEPHHDSRIFSDIFGTVPLAGFFCNGEIGPVGTATHLHGYTSSFALFRPANPGPA